MNLRRVVRSLHLWSAFLFGGMLCIAGLSGSLLAWRHELDIQLNPELMLLPSSTDSKEQATQWISLCDSLCKAKSINWLSAQSGYGLPAMMSFPKQNEHALIAWYPLESKSTASPLRYRQVMIDPHHLRILGERVWGEAGWQKSQWIPSLWVWHRYLLLGEIGKTLMAISGLMLALTSLWGLMLWWPKNSWKAWRQSLQIKWRSQMLAWMYSLHKTIGAMIATILIILGITGSYFNEPQWFFFLPTKSTPISPKPAPEKNNDKSKEKDSIPSPVLSDITSLQTWLDQAHTAYPQAHITRLQFPSRTNASIELRILQSQEPRLYEGNTRIRIDPQTHHITHIQDPLVAQGGQAWINWFYPLHSGEAFGTIGKLLISSCGLLLCGLIGSGFYLWWKRLIMKRHRQPQIPH